MGPTSSSCSQSISSSSSSWNRVQDKQFEEGLVIYSEETPNRWEKIASQVQGKTSLEVEQHYQLLIDDINAIEAGLVELPCYTDDLIDNNHHHHRDTSISFGSKSTTKSIETERRKGTPWTEEEHKLFLIGLQKYGKGDWRSISRNAVVSRTPTQVASHAQKYFNRINSDKKEKKRSSIHDITVDEASLVQANNQNMDASNPQSSFSNHVSGAYQGFRFPM
ncbi:transcription factor DIVARICATA-like [Thalictrum thalictroides]|uniref:Transcription factor DIVARICATA-like n=1 Tax=Thalictrum thalictroides TaxID=46969 RepID=A0A7J6UZ01_THATH|nr:transcription factor DIVARICATA-like [Thalictrum thalictroides]